MFGALFASRRRRISPLTARLMSVDERKIDGWVRSRQREPDVASDALALLIMMASGRFLKENMCPPPRYLGSLDLDVLAYTVLQYVGAAVWHALPDEWIMLKINADVFLNRMVKHETGWHLEQPVQQFSPRREDSGRVLGEEFLNRLQKLNGVKQPGRLPVRAGGAVRGMDGLKERLFLIGAVAAFQKTIPEGLVATLQNLVSAYNLEVARDDRMERLTALLRD